MKTKKSQVTIFIIIGILMLIIFGAFAYFSKQMKTTQTYSDTSPITTYINECLKRFTVQAIEISSQQSGYIYKSQGGSIIDPIKSDEGKTYLDYANRKVPYLIKRVGSGEDYPSKYWPYTPTYPSPVTNYKHTISVSKMQTTREMEQEVEYFIENKMKTDCRIQDDLKEYDIKTSKRYTTATITDEGISIHMTYPLEITELSTGNNLRTSEFLITEESPIKKLHETARYVIDKENQDFKFNLKQTTDINGITISLVENAYKQDDAIILNDPKTNSKFIFSRQNRKPAIEYTPTLPTNPEDIKAYDPDEDELKKEINSNIITASDGEFSDSQTIP